MQQTRIPPMTIKRQLRLRDSTLLCDVVPPGSGERAGAPPSLLPSPSSPERPCDSEGDRGCIDASKYDRLEIISFFPFRDETRRGRGGEEQGPGIESCISGNTYLIKIKLTWDVRVRMRLMIGFLPTSDRINPSLPEPRIGHFSSRWLMVHHR